MAKIITLAHQKGGVGKSTIALNLAHAFKSSISTAIVDIDPQGSISEASSKIEGVEVLPYKGVRQLANSTHEAILVDTPPYLSNLLPEIFSLSDLILIPTKAGIYDVIACRKTVALVKDAQKTNKKLKAAIILNMVNASTTLTEDAKDELKTLGLPVFKAFLTERMNFIRSVALPDGIYSTGDRKAVDEFNNLMKEVIFYIFK